MIRCVYRLVAALLLLLLSLASAAEAQVKNRAQLQTAFSNSQGPAGPNTCFPDNVAGVITPQTMRVCMQEFLASVVAIFGDINVVTNQMLSLAPPQTVKANIGGSSGSPTDVPLSTFFALAPASGGISTSQYGVSGSGLQTTGSMTSGSPALGLTSALDFANGQGILVNHAGTLQSLTNPSSVTATIPTTGSTTYNYQVVTCDAAGGYAATSVGATLTVSNGPASLSNLTNIFLNFTPPGGTSCFLVYRSVGVGQPLTFHGSTTLGVFQDVGQPDELLPFWVSSTPPSSPAADWLVTTIAAGAGTTNVRLAANAGTTASSTAVMHDDTAAMNAWVAAVNAAGGGLASIPTGQTIRISAGLNIISVSNVYFEGNGSVIAGAGASNASTPQAMLKFYSPSAVTTIGGFVCNEGVSTPLVNAPTLPSNAIVEYAQPAPTAAVYKLLTPIQSFVAGTSITNQLPCPIAMDNQQFTLTVGGTITANDTITVTVQPTGASSAYTTGTITVLSSDTTSTLAHKIATNLDNLQSLFISYGFWCWDVSNVGYCVNASTRTTGVTWVITLSGGATETVTQSTTTTGNTSDWFVPISGEVVDNIAGDGTNIVGRNGSDFSLVFCAYCAYSRFTNITGSNFYGGGTMWLAEGFANTAENIESLNSGDPGLNDISISDQTQFKGVNMHSHGAAGFGIGYQQGSYNEGVNLSADGTRSGRCFKMSAMAHSQITNIITNNCEDTGISLTWGTYRNNFENFSALGSGNGVQGNNEGVWFSDSMDRENQLSNGFVFGNGSYDIAISSSDLRNRFSNVRAGTILNFGGAEFVNGPDIVGAMQPPTLTSCTNGALNTGSPSSGDKRGFTLYFSGASTTCTANFPTGSYVLPPSCNASTNIGSPPTVSIVQSAFTGASSVTLAKTSFANTEAVQVICRGNPF